MIDIAEENAELRAVLDEMRQALLGEDWHDLVAAFGLPPRKAVALAVLLRWRVASRLRLQCAVYSQGHRNRLIEDIDPKGMDVLVCQLRSEMARRGGIQIKIINQRNVGWSIPETDRARVLAAVEQWRAANPEPSADYVVEKATLADEWIR